MWGQELSGTSRKWWKAWHRTQCVYITVCFEQDFWTWQHKNEMVAMFSQSFNVFLWQPQPTLRATQTLECNEKWSKYWSTFHYREQRYAICHCFSITLRPKDNAVPYGLGSTWVIANKCQYQQFYLMIVFIICFIRLPQVDLSLCVCVFLLAKYRAAKYSFFFVWRLGWELG